MKTRNTLAALAVAALVSAVGAAPASAQTSPPCTPALPATAAVNCAIDDAQWAVDTAQDAPDIVITAIDQAVNNAFNAIRDIVAEQDPEEIERQVYNLVCYGVIGTDPDSCVPR